MAPRVTTLRQRLLAIKRVNAFRPTVPTIGAWAEAAGVSTTNLNNYIKGANVSIAYEHVLALAVAGGIDPAWLLVPGTDEVPQRIKPGSTELQDIRAERLTDPTVPSNAASPHEGGASVGRLKPVIKPGPSSSVSAARKQRAARRR